MLLCASRGRARCLQKIGLIISGHIDNTTVMEPMMRQGRKRRICTALAAALVFCVYAWAPAAEKKGAPENTHGQKHELPAVYSELVLEDFEKTAFGPGNLEFRGGSHMKGEVFVSDQFPSPSAATKKYLTVRVFAAAGDIYRIRFTKEISVDRHCAQISFWAAGNRFPGELVAILADAAGTERQLHAGSLDFTGWKKITLRLDNRFRQDDEFLNQKRQFRLVGFHYRCTGASIEPGWHFFSLDDITAQVREKYIDHRSDDW